VKSPKWRKKINYSLFGNAANAGTTIPRRMWPIWNLEGIFGQCNSSKDPRSDATVMYEGRSYPGHVTLAKEGRRNTPAYRLWLDDRLATRLRLTFPMSYLRALERALVKDRSKDVEEENPFWEFLDIEFDAETRTFFFKAYYVQGATFPRLFREFIRSSRLEGIGVGNK
jgi:hypothetical protein